MQNKTSFYNFLHPILLFGT